MTRATDSSTAETPTDRSKRWVQVTAGVHLLSFLLYPAFICGCSFHAEAIPASAVPTIWGFYAYFFYRTKRERWIGYVNGTLSIVWILFAWDSNLKFAFRR